MQDKAEDRNGRLAVALRAPSLNGHAHKAPERVKDQPEGQGEGECEDYAFDRERESRHPVVVGGAREFRIGVRAEVSELSEEACVQRVDGDLQTRHGLNEGLNNGALGVKGGIATRQVILDELSETAMMELVGKVLPGREIGKRLVEPATEALPVLRDESGYQAADDGARHEQKSVEQFAYEAHGM